MIKPTVGRIVHYYPPKEYAHHTPGQTLLAGQPHAAIIATVWSDVCVNLMVIDRNGVPFGLTSVSLLQDDEQPGENHFGYCAWMPYQVEKAKVESATC